jgi:hypothetical protein
MKQFLALILTCFVGFSSSYAQSGTQALRLAQSIYEQGRLHELPTLPGLQDKEIEKYSKSDQVNAYRLLTLAHIYLEEPELADVSMLKLLDADHFYEPNSSVEPAEFMGLYRTFRTKPLFAGGLKVGGNSTMPLLNSLYYVSDGTGQGKYSTQVSIQFGLVFEKALFSNSKNKLLRKLTFAPEFQYTPRKFGYTNSAFLTGSGDFKGIIKQTWLELNLVTQLKLNKSKTFQTYVALGPGISYLSKGTLSAPQTSWTGASAGKGTVVGADVDNTKSYKKIIPTIIAAVGAKYKFGSIYVTGEFRVQYGLTSPASSSSRINGPNDPSVFEYNYILPDYKPLTVMANIGFVLPYFNPIKLKRK